MTLYQAKYQADKSGHCRRMTFAAPGITVAEQIARDWQIDACRPLIVRPLWELQRSLFEVAP